jgi:hypothetical protein
VKEEALPMMLSLYVTLGIFLLLAARNPSAHRSVIGFAAWSSLAHASVILQWLARRPVTVAIPADFPTEAATSIRPEIRIPASAQ